MSRRDAIIEKIMARVVMSDDVFDGEPHWLWNGPLSGNGRGRGYPRCSLDGQTVAVHRVIFTHFNGYIPGKKHIDHRCRVRNCVNPAHLRMVTHLMNCRLRDAARSREGDEVEP